jgi:hypothetical protein
MLGIGRTQTLAHMSISHRKGSHGGRPRYVERNKIDGKPFKDITPAEIVYCAAIKAWVFRHMQIRTADDYDNQVIDILFWMVLLIPQIILII